MTTGGEIAAAISAKRPDGDEMIRSDGATFTAEEWAVLRYYEDILVPARQRPVMVTVYPRGEATPEKLFTPLGEHWTREHLIPIRKPEESLAYNSIATITLNMMNGDRWVFEDGSPF